MKRGGGGKRGNCTLLDICRGRLLFVSRNSRRKTAIGSGSGAESARSGGIGSAVPTGHRAPATGSARRATRPRKTGPMRGPAGTGTVSRPASPSHHHRTLRSQLRRRSRHPRGRTGRLPRLARSLPSATGYGSESGKGSGNYGR